MFFFCEYCEMFKNTLFTEHLRATASDYTFLREKHNISSKNFGNKCFGNNGFN